VTSRGSAVGLVCQSQAEAQRPRRGLQIAGRVDSAMSGALAAIGVEDLAGDERSVLQVCDGLDGGWLIVNRSKDLRP
jgi:predicted RNA-binding Zn ribbon-like protein